MRLAPRLRLLSAPLVIFRVLATFGVWAVALGAFEIHGHWPDLGMRVRLPGWWG